MLRMFVLMSATFALTAATAEEVEAAAREVQGIAADRFRLSGFAVDVPARVGHAAAQLSGRNLGEGRRGSEEQEQDERGDEPCAGVPLTHGVTTSNE